MKIIHYSFHIGCINDAAYIFTTLGHDIVFRHLSFPNFCVTDEAARDFWKAHEAEFQSYDVILTTDTVALSYIFLNQIDRLKPHLLIWNCNRFDYAMWNNPRFYELVRMTNEVHHKVTYIPWTDYELLWCGKHGVHVSENTISSVGKVLKDATYTSQRVEHDFGGQRNEYRMAENADSMFVQKYLNHSNFIDLPRFLHSKGVSTVWGGYTRFEEIQPFKGVVVLPDSFCKMFAFESIQNEILVFLPTKRFLLELVKQPNYWYNVTGFVKDTRQLTGDYINLCEWYKYSETRMYFDSLDDMVTKIRGVTAEVLADKKRWMKFYGAQIETLSLTRWRGILDKVQIYKEQKLTSYYEQYPELAAFKKFRKVIVWGYPLGSHTHSYIHGAWVKALTCLGLPVSWYHDGNFPATEDFSNCCFITEGWADKQIPVVASSTYFVHIAPNPAKYLEKGARLIEIRHNVERINDYNYLYTLPTDAEALSPDTLYRLEPNDAAVAAKRGRPVSHVPYEAVYMYWATDLLPHEIDYEDASAPHEKVLYHIGTLDGGHPLKNMKPVAEAEGVAFVHKNPWQTPLSYEEHIRLMKASYCCPDYRNYVGIDSERKGYIPCRVFKAISYGQSGITNSERTKALLGDHVEYVSSLTEIFSVTERRKEDVRWRQAAMKHVAERHTYIHRLRDLARALAKDPQTKKKKVVVIAEKGWSIDRVHKGVASALSSEYSFQYHDARHVFMDRFLADFRAADICLTSMNFYYDMIRIFPGESDRCKIVIIAHGISDMWGMPTKGDVCTSFTYGVTSEVLAGPMLDRLGVPLCVTPNGVDPSDYSYRDRNGVVKTVGWCGSEALEIKRVSWAKEIAASVGLELRIAATVPREEMAAWYNSIDLLLVTSGPDVTAESGPLPPFEAIMAGVPVIGTSVGNFSLIPGPKFATVEEGVATLRSLMSDPTQVVEVAKEQRESVLASLTYDALASKWTALFEATMNRTMSDCVFMNDGGVKIKLVKHRFSDVFRRRDNHEVLFRKISSYLIKQGIVKGNIVDLGAWIGDNSIPWALLSDRCIYAIDPSPDNCSYIAEMAALNDITNVTLIQKAISDKTEVLSTNGNIDHCSFVYNHPGAPARHTLESCSLDQLYRDQVIQDVGYIHLDVEGMEAKVVAGATELIQACRPIIAFEQHLDLDDYRGLSRCLISKGYTVFLNNEVLPGCRHDCRNLFAFPSESMTHDFIDSIHAAIGVNSLVLIT